MLQALELYEEASTNGILLPKNVLDLLLYVWPLMKLSLVVRLSVRESIDQLRQLSALLKFRH